MPTDSNRRVTRSILAAAAALAMLTAGCSDDAEQPMMTYQQAADTVERLIHDTTATLQPTPRLEPLSNIRTVPCSGPNDDRETGKVMVERTYWLRDVDPARNVDLIHQAQQYWSTNSYQTTQESGSADGTSYDLVVTHPGNRFRVGLAQRDGVLSVRAQSTCIRRPAG